MSPQFFFTLGITYLSPNECSLQFFLLQSMLTTRPGEGHLDRACQPTVWPAPSSAPLLTTTPSRESRSPTCSSCLAAFALAAPPPSLPPPQASLPTRLLLRGSGICPGRPGSLYRAPRLGEVASCASKCASSPRFPPRCDFPFTRRPPPLPVLWAMIFWHRGFVIFIPASQAYLALQSMFLIYIGPTHARSRRLYEGKSK